MNKSSRIAAADDYFNSAELNDCHAALLLLREIERVRERMRVGRSHVWPQGVCHARSEMKIKIKLQTPSTVAAAFRAFDFSTSKAHNLKAEFKSVNSLAAARLRNSVASFCCTAKSVSVDS